MTYLVKFLLWNIYNILHRIFKLFATISVCDKKKLVLCLISKNCVIIRSISKSSDISREEARSMTWLDQQGIVITRMYIAHAWIMYILYTEVHIEIHPRVATGLGKVPISKFLSPLSLSLSLCLPPSLMLSIHLCTDQS